MFRVVTLFTLIVVASASEGKTLRLYVFFGSVMFTFSSLSVFEQANLQTEEISIYVFVEYLQCRRMPQCLQLLFVNKSCRTQMKQAI